MRLKRALAESRAAQDKLNSTTDSRCTADSYTSLAQRFGGVGRPQSARYTHGVPMNSTDSTDESSYSSGRTPGDHTLSRKDPQVMETATPSSKSPLDLASRFSTFIRQQLGSEQAVHCWHEGEDRDSDQRTSNETGSQEGGKCLSVALVVACWWTV
jgi:hypothetical protein